jgi:hypothetical protein
MINLSKKHFFILYKMCFVEKCDIPKFKKSDKPAPENLTSRIE